MTKNILSLNLAQVIITDLCYHFSVETLSRASDRNFDKINSNFGQVLLNERKLQSDMQIISQAMESKLTADQKTQSALLAYHISIHFQQVRSIYIESLQNLLTNIEPPQSFLFVRNLIYNKDYCQQFSCYQNSYFSRAEGIITVHTEKHSIFLAQKALITCQLFPSVGSNTISIFHNIIVSKEKQIYIPDNKEIPNFNISALHIHTRQRKLIPKDLLDDTVLLIHDGPKIAFQCVTNTSLDLDGIMYACSPTSFDWFTPPTKVTNLATGHVILNVEKLKTVHARWTLENINSPIPVQTLLVRPPLPHLSKRIVNYFNKTDPI